MEVPCQCLTSLPAKRLVAFCIPSSAFAEQQIERWWVMRREEEKGHGRHQTPEGVMCCDDVVITLCLIRTWRTLLEHAPGSSSLQKHKLHHLNSNSKNSPFNHRFHATELLLCWFGHLLYQDISLLLKPIPAMMKTWRWPKLRANAPLGLLLFLFAHKCL